MTKTVIKKSTLTSQVYEHLKEDIILGRINPGERLIEEKIAEELQVSRSPIREAVRMLEKDGLLSVNKSGGVTVVKPSIEDFRYLYECRVEIESLAAYYAAERRSAEQLEEIRLHILKMEKVTSDNYLKNVYDVNVSFHESIVRASGNPFLISMTSQLRGVNSLYRKAILEFDPKRVVDASAEHLQIFQAIVDQDNKRARKLMKQHIEEDYKLFMKSAMQK
ncbi:GntR family transcriptional regulator [Sporosarcina sp. ANT_H38]|uniref:GntR family transcriptional regulator n=1 Tax=Sporosarcina sp. ANT_H38 TaxID=2597358 RepID=UPI0011F11F47|nr:GntR family transcriptional regulator [Sporosarcina sp. ANT_H38]KAA0966852.1 GntR family transcriptional regulator [Sporosarcina sp. ANT_H38]